MPARSAYAPVNGLHLYYETHGSRDESDRPLVLLHGGILTIDLTWDKLLPTLAKTREVIAIELQGHGHTADTDRDFSLVNLASDVVGLLDHLDVERADLFGFSLGAMTALQAAISSPDRVGRVVLASAHYRADGYRDEIRDPQAHLDSDLLPTEDDFRQMQQAYASVAPDPAHFGAFMAKASAMVDAFQGWSDDTMRAVDAPTLLMVGDHDFVRLEHAVAMHELIPGSQLAVLPATTHMGVTQRAEIVLPTLERFLAG
jgi:pimeloyl-ACP methyl ester carboxylesterase